MKIPKLAIALGVAALGATTLGTLPALGADHRDSPLTKTNAQLDINDVYFWKNTFNGGTYAMTVNPLTSPAATAGLRLSTTGLYEFKVDSNGDAVADAALKFSFSGTDAVQDVTVRLATGAGAISSDPIGEVIAQGKTSTGSGVTSFFSTDKKYKFYVGPRDDPFFFDLAAFNKGLAFTSPGVDTFKGTNITAIVVEEQGPPAAGSSLGIWGTTSRPSTLGAWEQFDRMGRPAILTVFIPTLEYLNDTSPSVEDAFNQNNPDRDKALFKSTVVGTLNALKSNPALADVLLPDILTLDLTKPGGYLNGRGLADDVIDISLQVITGNAAAGDNVPANDNAFLAAFPHLAAPNGGGTAPAAPNTGSGIIADEGGFGGYGLAFGLLAAAGLLAGAVVVTGRANVRN